MASKTSIANGALYKVGETRVSNISNNSSKKALIINDRWDTVRDALLQSFPWNFAIKRVQIAKDGTAPAWGFSNRYLLPVDFLNLLYIQDDPDYRIESGYILTNHGSPLYIKYTSRIEAAGDWDPMFAEAMSAQLAVECVESITQSNTKKDILMRERDKVIREAYAADSIDDKPQELRDDEWLLARESSSDRINYNA